MNTPGAGNASRFKLRSLRRAFSALPSHQALRLASRQNHSAHARLFWLNYQRELQMGEKG
jgi:hypothetical protein